VHNDIFRMIKYAVEEMVTAGDQASRLLEFWTAIVEQLFGLPPRDAQARVAACRRGGVRVRLRGQERGGPGHAARWRGVGGLGVPARPNVCRRRVTQVTLPCPAAPRAGGRRP